jgi:hypothetical protein
MFVYFNFITEIHEDSGSAFPKEIWVVFIKLCPLSFSAFLGWLR